MTALAFLFAVFLARPCPFYILDEVEAALDDLNIDRFLELLRHLLRARPVHRRHPPEAHDGGGRLAVRRVDAVGRRLEGDLAPPPAASRTGRLSLRFRMARDWRDLFIVDGAPPPSAPNAAPADPGAAPRHVPPPAREPAQDPAGAHLGDPGHAVRGPERRDVGTAGGGADLRRRRREHHGARSSSSSSARPRRAGSPAARR